jgi:predicted nucleic acid-binding protein
MATLVDSNVLLDVFTNDPNWSEWSSRHLDLAASEGQLLINPVIYAEVSVRFATIEELEKALPANAFRYAEIPKEAAFLAGKTFLAYKKAGGTREVPLPDFFIGAQALVEGWKLLTRDGKGYRGYFPKLEIVYPA